MPHPALAMALVGRRALVRAATAVVLVIVLSLGVVVSTVALALAGEKPESSVGCVSSSGAVTQSVLESRGYRPDGQAVGLSAGQIAVAQGYISVGKQLGVPREAMVIAI